MKIIGKFLLLILPFAALSFKALDENDLYYKLSIETMFNQKDEPKIRQKLSDALPEMEVIKITYETKTIIIKVKKQTPYDTIKQSFDKADLKITKEVSFKTYQE